MLPLKDLLAITKPASKEIREAFLEAVNTHPTWFIWSLAALPAQSSDPRAQRIVFVHVKGADQFTLSLSNVAGIRVFDNAKSNFVAVDLLAYDRALRLNLLNRRRSSYRELVQVLHGNTTIIDYFSPPVFPAVPSAFVWLAGSTGPAWEQNASLLSKSFSLERLSYTQRVVRAFEVPTTQPGLSAPDLANLIAQKFGPLVQGALPARELQLRSEDEVQEATEQLCDFLEAGKSLDEAWTIQRTPTYDPGADADWRGAVKLSAAWDEVSKKVGQNWFKECIASVAYKGGDPNKLRALHGFCRPNVVLLDTAVDFDHPALFHTWIGTGDAAFPTAEALSDQLRRNYHGTACASLIAGYDISAPEAVAFRGVGAGAFVGSIRVRAGSSSNNYGYPVGGLPPYLDADLTTADQIRQAILEAADYKANVICLSLQYNTCSVPEEEDAGMRSIREAIRHVTEKGVCVVVAAGNALRPGDTKLKFPAYLDDVIAVAATREGTRETAPGKGDFYNCWLASRTICKDCVFEDPPDAADPASPSAVAGQAELPAVCQGGSGCWSQDCLALQSFGSRWEGATLAAPGTNIWAADVSDFGGIKLGGEKGNYIDFYATSAAAPIVAGTVALMLMVKPGLKPARVKTILAETAKARPVKVADWALGKRLTMKFGFLDCAAAVAAAAAEP